MFRATWSLRRARRSSEYVCCAQSHGGPVRPGDRARLDLAVDSGRRHVRASLRDVSNEIELNESNELS